MAEYLSLSTSFNPWSTDHGSVAGMQLGDPETGLVIARRHDLLPMEEDCDEILSSINNTSSMKVLDTLQEMASISSELHEIELEFQKQSTDKETADIVHTYILRERLSIINLLLEHFTSVVTQKDTLVGRLQSQAADNPLVIEAAYQRHTTEVLASLGLFVSQFPANIDKARWHSSLKMDTNSLSMQMSEIAQSIAQCKGHLQTSQQLHEIIE